MGRKFLVDLFQLLRNKGYNRWKKINCVLEILNPY